MLKHDRFIFKKYYAEFVEHRNYDNRWEYKLF